MGCTEREWLAWLPGSAHGHPLMLDAGRASIAIGAGRLQLRWQVLAPRRIGLVRLPRLVAQFHFDRVDEEARQRFMRYFDLYMQRGGG